MPMAIHVSCPTHLQINLFEYSKQMKMLGNFYSHMGQELQLYSEKNEFPKGKHMSFHVVSKPLYFDGHERTCVYF